MAHPSVAPAAVPGEIRPAYRPSIDGLRGIAIASVVLYHANASLLPGGFIGVDIFFVISGFLISSLIFKELELGRFGFADFYARRIRRIFPALVLVMAVVWLAGLLLLTSREFVNLNKFIFAAGLSATNLLEWHQIGYFDAAASQKPLLHLWSLGIEEQFYLLWPALVVLLWKRKLRAAILLAIVVSFAFNIWSTPRHASEAFYLPFGRAWELLLGSVLAWPRFQHAPPLKDAATWLGLAFLVIGFVFITPSAQFPGWWVLLPALGSFLLIWAGEAAWINSRALANPGMVFVGLISYPLYLWHWPLLSFLRIVEGKAPSPGATAMAVIAAVILAVLTWWLVERPLRANRRIRGKSVAVLVAAMLAIIALSVLSFGRIIQTPRMAREAAEDQVAAPLASRDCRGLVNERSPAYLGCRIFGDPNASRTFVLWGDSFAGTWEAPAEALARRRGARLVQFMFFGCPPLIGIRRLTSPMGDQCADFVLASTILQTITTLKPDLTILAARWSAYVEPRLGSGVPITASPTGGFSKEISRAALKTQLPETVHRLAQLSQVIIIKGVPSLHMTTDAGLARDPAGFEPGRPEHDALEAFPNAVIDQAAHDNRRVTILDPTPMFCDRDKCHAILQGVRAYLPEDKWHLSRQGALLFLPQFEALAE